MKTIFLNLAGALLCVPVLGVPVLAAPDEPAGEDFSCALVQGAADVLVDGSLSEWNARAVAHPLRSSKSVSAEPTDFASATARCLAADRFLYFGVAVSASSVRFETLPFNQAWRNDSVEVFFSSRGGDPSPHVRAGLIRVSLDSDGRVVTEGSASVADGVRATRSFSYPLLLGAMGVKTGLQPTPPGYTVEIAIPRHSLGWIQGAVPEVSINLRVRRSCAGKPCQMVLESSDDPYNSSPVSDGRYRRVSFGRQPAAATRSVAPTGDDEVLVALPLYRALLRMDVLDPDGAVAILRESQDRRLLPVMASALIAAGHLDSARSALNSIAPGQFGEAVRFWITEQMAYSDSSAARRAYEELAASGRPAFQDIGVAGLIDLHLADGRADAAMAAYQSAFGGSPSPGIRSASRIADWLQKHGRGPEAMDVLTQISESASAHNSERAWALLQLQSLYQRSGDIEKAIATAWRLQALAPPGDPSGEAGLKMLIDMATFGRTASSPATPFSDSYQRFLEANPAATDPARGIAYAAELRWEGKSGAAAKLYEEIGREAGARPKDRAAALLSLQRLRLDFGQMERSVETGLAIQDVLPLDVVSRLASWRWMREAGAAPEMPISLRQQVEDAGRALGREMRRWAQNSTDSQTVLLQFEKELNPQ